MIEAVLEHRMLQDVHRLGVALSGGADSLSLMEALWWARQEGRLSVDLHAIHVNQYGHAGNIRRLAEFVQVRYGLELEIIEVDTRDAARRMLAQGKAPCRACAPLRAEAIATQAQRSSFDAVALGHHLNDALATMLLNIFHSGAPSTMRLVSRRGASRTRILRPLLLAAEEEVKAASPAGDGGLFNCGLCGVHASERARMSAFVAETLQLHGPQCERYARLSVLSGGSLPRFKRSAGPRRHRQGRGTRG